VLVLSGQFLKLLGTLSLALLVVAAHMVFKPRSVKSKVGGGTASERRGLDRMQAAFLNPVSADPPP